MCKTRKHARQPLGCLRFTRWSPLRPATSKEVPSLQKIEKIKQQSKVGEEIKLNKYQPHVPRRLCISNLEVHERSHIARVSLPPKHLPKAPPKKIGNYEGFLTTMVPWESPEQAVTDCAHKKI